MTRDEMCRSLVDAHSDIHDVLVHTAADRAGSEQIRVRLAADFLLVEPGWHSTLERISGELQGLLNEVHAAPEWTSTMDEIAQEIVADLNRQLDQIAPDGPSDHA
jgi:hypothetical protein